MHAFLVLARLTIALNFRNRMAVIYGYVFPLVFLLTFWVLYRHEPVPIALHLGELLTVTILGGACFGLPTALVSERERGVWRRYRVTPASTAVLIGSTVVARFVLLITAALLQVAVALAIGMPAPAHPVGLFAAFTAASIAFLGLGMVIAMLANSVPAVQALGQCIFLPMLVIGGVAVRLSSLPDWALHLSAFFPGRYAVKALQESTTGAGAQAAIFDCLALLGLGLAAGIAAAGLYRWDSGARRLSRRAMAAVGLGLGLWVAVGASAEVKGRVAPDPQRDTQTPALTSLLRPRLVARAQPPRAPATPAPKLAIDQPVESSRQVDQPPAPEQAVPAPAPNWDSVTAEDFAQVAFERLPSDQGIVSPVASAGEEPDPLIAAQLDTVRQRLPDWPPGHVADPVQRVRNLLLIAAVPDVLQMSQLERHLPLLVEAQLRRGIPSADLPKLLYWVAMHPNEGDDRAIGALPDLGLPPASGPTKAVRGRVMLYALKLLGRETGAIKP